MSVFSKLKQSRKAAKEHKSKSAEKEVTEVTKLPYKHVPTHAAVDALSGAPSSWKHEDRSKIKEHHKRRSEMVISRTGSSLSTVSYMNSAAGPSSRPPLPRNSSYSSYNPTWYDRSGDPYYSNESSSQQQRYKQSRGHSYHDSGIGPSIGPSPLASNMQSEDVSPAVSSGTSQKSSTSDSSDNLEIATKSNRNRPSHQTPSTLFGESSRPQPTVYAEKDIFDRLHTSTTRKLGEAPLYASPPVHIKTTTSSVVVQEQRQEKKPRWSLLGKKNTAVIAT